MKANALVGKVAVTGTGRCGTTFLMRLLTAYDPTLTGYRKHNVNVLPDIQAGMEHQARETWTPGKLAALPTVWKDPALCYELGRLARAGHRPEAVIVPVRNLYDAAQSRFKANRPWFPHQEANLSKIARSAWPKWATVTNQARALGEALGTLVADCTVHQIPMVLIPWDDLGDATMLRFHLVRSLMHPGRELNMVRHNGHAVEGSIERFQAAHALVWGNLVTSWRQESAEPKR